FPLKLESRGTFLNVSSLIHWPMALPPTAVGMMRIDTLSGTAGSKVLAKDRPQSSPAIPGDRKSTRLNSSHVKSSYAVFCLNTKLYIHHRPCMFLYRHNDVTRGGKDTISTIDANCYKT